MLFSALTLYDQLKFEIKKWLDYRGNSWKDFQQATIFGQHLDHLTLLD